MEEVESDDSDQSAKRIFKAPQKTSINKKSKIPEQSPSPYVKGTFENRDSLGSNSEIIIKKIDYGYNKIVGNRPILKTKNDVKDRKMPFLFSQKPNKNKT